MGRNLYLLTIIGAALFVHKALPHKFSSIIYPSPLQATARSVSGLLLFVLLLSSSSALALDTNVTALTNQSCAGTRSATNLLCTANDFTASATFTQPSATALASCLAGETLSLDVIASITSQQAQRYDVGIFLGEHGNAPNLNDATATCSLGVFPVEPDPPYFNDDGDSCGDYRKSSTSNLTILDIEVRCLPAPGTNNLGIPYAVVFDNQPSGATCSAANITAGTSSKCTMGIGPEQATVVDLTVNGYVTLTKQTNPDGATGSFAFTASGSAAATPASFSLTDGQSERVEIPLSPTGGDQTLLITEAQLGGWDPNVTITCTDPAGGPAPHVTVDPANRRLTATLNATRYGALCTITNQRLPTITVSKQSNGGTGSFSFSGTNGIDSFSLDTTAANPQISATYPVTAASTETVITEALPSGWSLSSASCTDGTTVFGTLSGGTLTIPATALGFGKNLACTFTNNRNQTQLTLVKSASSPTVNPGQVITYTVIAANSDAAAASGVVLEDHLSLFTSLGLNSYGSDQPFELLDSTPASGLALGSPAYSSDHGTSWSYLPTSTGGGAPAGYDALVTNWRIPMLGTMRPGGSITLRYQVQVK